MGSGGYRAGVSMLRGLGEGGRRKVNVQEEALTALNGIWAAALIVLGLLKFRVLFQGGAARSLG